MLLECLQKGDLSYNRFELKYEDYASFVIFQCYLLDDDIMEIYNNRLEVGGKIEMERALLNKYVYDVFVSNSRPVTVFNPIFFFSEECYLEWLEKMGLEGKDFATTKWFNSFVVEKSIISPNFDSIRTKVNELGLNFTYSGKKLDKFYYTPNAYRKSVGYCSDNNCPCSQVMIPNGMGYWYVEYTNGRFTWNLVCEEGARLRKLDLTIAREDAVNWWRFGLTPLRETPTNNDFQEAPYGATLSSDYQKRARKEMLDFASKLWGLDDVKYIFFDTETTGLPNDYKAPVSDLLNWPRLVQLAWVEYDKNDKLLKTEDLTIKPDGFIIPKSASDVHGITTEEAVRTGIDLKSTLNKFLERVENADIIVGHNIDFDLKIIGAELVRTGLSDPFAKKETFCTMHRSTNFCAILGRYDNYKWPKLQELHLKLFGQEFENAHNAFADIEATAKCFFELKKRNIISQ